MSHLISVLQASTSSTQTSEDGGAAVPGSISSISFLSSSSLASSVTDGGFSIKNLRVFHRVFVSIGPFVSSECFHHRLDVRKVAVISVERVEFCETLSDE